MDFCTNDRRPSVRCDLATVRERERVSKVCFYGRLKIQLEIIIKTLFTMAQETAKNHHHHPCQRSVSNLLEVITKANHHCRPDKSHKSPADSHKVRNKADIGEGLG